VNPTCSSLEQAAEGVIDTPPTVFLALILPLARKKTGIIPSENRYYMCFYSIMNLSFRPNRDVSHTPECENKYFQLALSFFMILLML